MSKLSFSHNAQNNRMYLGINRESIWITRPTDEQLETLRTKTLVARSVTAAAARRFRSQPALNHADPRLLRSTR